MAMLRVVGLMSGTSGDGIDVGVMEIAPEAGAVLRPAVKLLGFCTVPFTPAQREQLFRLLDSRTEPAVGLREICEANFDLGRVFGEAVLTAVAELALEGGLESVDVICSHGQTVWHAPPHSTLQIGEAAVIAELTGKTVVSDFRVADVAAGGQGAPVTSAVDAVLLASPAGWRAVQNIGGFANVTFVPPLTAGVSSAADQPAPVPVGVPTSFDTGPGNALLDFAVSQLTDGKLQYDVDGVMAAAAEPDAKLLATMLAHPYFDRRPPKTTGREEFTTALAAEWLTAGAERGLSPECMVSTFTELTAASIADAYAAFAPCGVAGDAAGSQLAEVVIGGGGGRNPTLLRRLKLRLAKNWSSPANWGQADVPAALPPRILMHEELGWDSDAKESVVFGLLGWLCCHGLAGNIPTCTGAQAPRVLGKLSPGSNYRELNRKLAAAEKVLMSKHAWRLD
jgi:anhydro-N-acetylmuramic acid kinase